MDQSASAKFDLEAHLEKIQRVTDDLRKIPHEYLGPTGTKLPDIAWFVLAAINKTASLTHAFCALTRAKNTMVAASLIRLQLDTAMRMFGLSLVTDVECAGTLLMNDGSYRKLRSRDGEWLTDALLHRKLNEHYPGLSDAYEATSAYVHLSAMHIKTGLTGRPGTSTLFFDLTGTDDSRPDEWFAELVDSFDQATTLTGELIEDFMRYRYAGMFGVSQPK